MKLANFLTKLKSKKNGNFNKKFNKKRINEKIEKDENVKG